MPARGSRWLRRASETGYGGGARPRVARSPDDAKYKAIYVNYVSEYNINMTQFSPSNWTAYASVNDFF